MRDLHTTYSTILFWAVYLFGYFLVERAGKPRSKVLHVVRHAFVIAIAFACLWVSLSAPRIFAYSPGTIFVLTMLLGPLARDVIAPWGLVKPAYYVGWAGFGSADERSGNALLAGAVALSRRREYDPELASWLEDRIQADRAIRGTTIVASAATAAARGDKEGARVLFESLRTLDEGVVSRAARSLAAEWLSAEAASRGAWSEVAEIGGDLLASGRSAWFLGAVARRLLVHPDAPGRFTLVLRWLLAPRRFDTFAILERALSVPDDAGPPDDGDAEPAADSLSPGDDPLARALAAHVRLLAAHKPSPKEIAEVGRAFDEALSAESLASHIEERGALLGAMRAPAVIGRLRDDIEDALFHLLKHHRIPLDDTEVELGDIAHRAQRRLRDETLGVIEALSDAVRSRVNEKRPLSAVDEWREWTALRIAYERGVLLGGPELRYLAFTKVHSDVCALAVWLFNTRKEKPIANAMFRFLLREATTVGDAEAIALQTKNVDCGT